MYKRLVDAALAAGVLDPAPLAGYTDEGILHALGARPDGATGGVGAPALAAARSRACATRCASGGCTSARSSARPPSSPTGSATGWRRTER
jgi:hypothetical protein